LHPSEKEISIEGSRLMLIDDDAGVRGVVAELLSMKGWSVAEFSDAESALDELKSGGFDLVLTDINMPGMSGMDFLHAAKETASEVPVVMITGYPSLDLAVEAMKEGAVDFLAKPFKAEDLHIVIGKALYDSKAKKAATAGPVSRAIEKLPAVARRRLEDKIKELSILHTISETLDTANEKEDIFRKTMDIGQIITDADKAFVMVVEDDNRELVVRAVSGYDEGRLLGSRFSSAEEPFASVIKSRSHSYLNVSGGDLEPLIVGTGEGGRAGALLLAPMLMNNEVVVLLGLGSSMNAPEISNDVLTLVLNLTAKASMKLENITLSENVFSSIIGALNSLINALDARDTYTRDHSNRVTQYALMIAKSMGCEQGVLDSIGFAGPLHDIGKIGVRDDILLKKGSFSVEEREIMKGHVVRGEEILRPLNLLETEKAVVLYHHERWDGGGYPNGLSGDEIPFAARIFSVADTFDAMTSTRPYRKALSRDIARDEIVRCRESQFDPDVVEAFLGSEILKDGNKDKDEE